MQLPSRKAVRIIIEVIRIPEDKSLHINQRHVRHGLRQQCTIVTESGGPTVARTLPIAVYLHMDHVHAICSVGRGAKTIAGREDIEGGV